MADIKQILEEKKIQIEKYLAALDRGGTSLLKEAMDYTLLAGGKRLRPCLFLLTAELYGVTSERLLPFAAGLEMIHAYSLIHDDLPAMDNDDYRRGKPTNHKVFGEGQAILAGDALLSEAFYQMALPGQTEAPDRVVAAIRCAADHAGIGGMVLGQSLDLLGEGRELTLAELQEIHDGKTGALISLAFVAAALLCGAPEHDVAALDRFGRSLGLAFQIADDILDHEGSFEELGKPIGSDESNAKVTYISLLGLDGAKAAGAEALAAANTALDRLSVDTALLKALGDVVFNRKH